MRNMRDLSLLVIVSSLVLGEARLFSAPMNFTNVTPESGITFRHEFVPFDEVQPQLAPHNLFTAGCVAEDFDGDGWIDLFLVQGNTNKSSELYMNNGDMTFTEQGALRGADIVGLGVGVAAADFDNDGDIDICVTNSRPPHVLLINEGSGFFRVDNTTLQLPAFRVTSPSWGDINNDGYLELLIGQWATQSRNLWVFLNVGGTSLQDYIFTDDIGVDRNVFSPRFADVNNDGWQDLLITSDFRSSQLYLNDKNAYFERVTASSGVAKDNNGMGSAVGDYDNDGDLDWFVTAILNEDFPGGNRLYENLGQGVFNDATFSAGVNDGGWGWGAVFSDFDLDGDLDLFHVNGWVMDITAHWNEPARLFENLGNGVFSETAQSAGIGNTGVGRAALCADFDNDGDQDIFVGNNMEVEIVDGNITAFTPGLPALYRNDTITSNSWVKIELQGTPPHNSHGIGARVYLRDGPSTQMRELNASTGFMGHGPNRIAHFGLGGANVIPELSVAWTNGDRTLIENAQVNRVLRIKSPAASISNRMPYTDEFVTLDASMVEPLGAVKRWWMAGVPFDDPATVRVGSDNQISIRLQILDAGTTETLREEFYSIEPQKRAAANPSLWMALE